VTTTSELLPEAAIPADPQPVTLSKFHRWGVAIALRRRTVLWVFGLAILLCGALYPLLLKELGPPPNTIPGTESARVEQLLEHRFPTLGSEYDAVVFYSPRRTVGDRAYRAVVTSALQMLRHEEGVKQVVSPYSHSLIDLRSAGKHTAAGALARRRTAVGALARRRTAVGALAHGKESRHTVGLISSDRHAAIGVVVLGGSARRRFDRTSQMQSAVAGLAQNGVHVWLTGYSPIVKDLADVENTDASRAEMIGLPVALLVLLVAMGAVMAALLPLLVAGAGLLLVYGVLGILGAVLHFDSLLLAVATMIGLGIGIDYALFIVSRFREELACEAHDGRSEDERVAAAVGAAIATSGRTIMFSGMIVALSLTSLLAVNSPFFREMAVGGAIVVMCMLVTSLTLLPAMLAVLGPRINRGALSARLQPADARSRAEDRTGGWARWALLMMRHPGSAVCVAGAVLILAALPVLGIRYGVTLGVLSVPGTSAAEGEAVLARSFTPGAIAPIEVVLSEVGGDRRAARRLSAGARTLTDALERDRRVTGVVVRHAKAGDVLTVVPSVPIDSSKANALVTRIRSKLAPRIQRAGGPTVLVGGATAQGVDLANEMRAKFPLVLVLILCPALIFLMLVFRSVVLPIKAVLMNLLVTSATVGLVVFVFQGGHGEHFLGFTNPGFIQAYLPLLVFALLFGVSMDYEVFLIRRVQEEWKRTHDNRRAVATGIEHTARPISAAAAIMVAVFGSFVTANLLELKQLGFALALAVALDATMVRLVLVPAAMRLLGAWNWWLPERLGKLLPNISVD
jgi:putative drug exporter of the RND superfamily